VDLLRSLPAGEESVSPEAVRPSPAGVEALATYYAKRFNGRRTASGERYRPEKLTAAHRDLPLGTRVRVTDLRTGKEVVVRVNDRCRKRRAPLIDLSRAAAKELGFLGKGIARVRIEPLSELPGEDESMGVVVWAESP
jgi:rare lipoprotein A